MSSPSHPYGALLSAPATFLGEEGDETGPAADDEEVEVKVSIYKKTSPDSCYAVAVGIVHERTGPGPSDESEDGSSWRASLFVKDRDLHESVVQATNYRVGALVSSALSVPSDLVVATSYSIERPALADLAEGSAARLLWRRKDDAFDEKKEELEKDRRQRVKATKKYNKKFGVEPEDEEEDDVEDERPSMYACWQIEEAAYYLPEGESRDAVASEGERPDAGGDVDASLRAKLRRAARRSPSGTLHLWDVLVLAECCQEEIRDEAEGWEECDGQLLDDARDALTQEETFHLLNVKLNSPEVEASMLFTAIVALPDAHACNLVVREFLRESEDDSESAWGLALVNIDTGTPPVKAGAHLDSFQMLSEDHDFHGLDEYDGSLESYGYNYPIMLQLLGEEWTVSPRGAEGLLALDASAVRRLVEGEYSNPALERERDMTRYGSIAEERIVALQDAVRGDPKIGLRDLCFRACGAWKRDWAGAKEDEMGETVEWMKHWARTGENPDSDSDSESSTASSTASSDS